MIEWGKIQKSVICMLIIFVMVVLQKGMSVTAIENKVKEEGVVTVPDKEEQVDNSPFVMSSIAPNNLPLNTSVQPMLVTDDAYLSQFFVQKIIDGTAGFDEDSDPNSPYYSGRVGNDASSDNGIVRTFDSITYDLVYVTQVYTDDVFYGKGVLEFEFILPLTAQEAQWNIGVMSWMDLGHTVTTEVLSYDFNGDGMIDTDETNVSCQVLRGKRTLVASGGNPSAIPGQGSLIAAIDVLGMKNESIVRPVFTAWMQHNQAGDTKLGGTLVTGNDNPCENEEHQEVLKNGTNPVRTTEQVTVLANKVTVTAEPRYNVEIKASTTNYVKDIYDFNQGNAFALDMGAGLVEGRVAGYGITLQLYNNKDRGLKGIELPQGPITLDIELETSFIPAVPQAVLTNEQQEYVQKNYKPLVLSYDEHRSGGGQQDGRDLKNNVTGVGDAAPYNRGTSAAACYNGGTWRATRNTSTDIISITVSDYVINPKHFPSAHASGGNVYYNPEIGIENIGCFSAGEFFVVTPFNNNGTSDSSKKGTYILDDLKGKFGLNTADGTFDTTIKGTNLRATSITGKSLPVVSDNSNQMRQDDDAKNKIIYLARPGSHDWVSIWTLRLISLGDGFSDVLGRSHTVPGEWTNYGLDTLARGSKVGVGIGFNNGDNGDTENIAVAANILGKFDADVVTLNGNTSAVGVSGYGLKYQILYGTKPDGSNWSSDDEMEEMRIENLQYYTSLTDIPVGHKCVAVLAEIRPVGKAEDVIRVSGGNRVRILLDGEVNRELSLIGNVYQTVIGGEIWRRHTYDENKGIESMLGKTPVPYNPALSVTDPRPNQEQVPTVTGYRRYDKVTYHDDGTVTGHTGSFNYGDSLRIVDTTTNISKNITQKNLDNEKTIYQLDANQRYVDFVLEPRFDPLPEGLSAITTVTVMDTLPENVHYEAGSAYIGGTYQQNMEEGQPGTVLGGVSAEPEVGQEMINGKERTTLKWVFPNVDTRDGLPIIYFTAMIGNMSDSTKDVLNNQQFINTATIESTDDRRPKAVSTGNLSEAGFTVSKLRASSLSKIPSALRYNIGDEMGFQVNVGNNSGTTLNNALIMDTLPLSGDKKGSNFDGDLFVTNVVIDETALGNLSEWKCFYTTSDDVKNTSAENYDISDILGNPSTWKNVSIESDGTIPELKDIANIRAIIFIGNLGGGKVFKMNMDLQIPQAKAGAVIANTISSIKDQEVAIEESAQARVRIVDRQISGMVWNDVNRDGQRVGGNETAIYGIRVQLLKKDEITGVYQEVTDLKGNPIFVETSSTKKTETFQLSALNNLGNAVVIHLEATADENGTYLFSGLPEGTYGVRFVSGTTPMEWYYASPVKAGTDTSIDSDGVPTFDLDGLLGYTTIKDIVLPKLEDLLSGIFVTRYHDSGLYMREVDLTIGKSVAKGDKTQSFDFIIELRDGKNQNLESTYEYTGIAIAGVDTPESDQITFINGEASVTLKHGQSIVIKNLPIDTTYTIREVLNIGWTAEQQTIKGRLEEKQEVYFVNHFTPKSTDIQISVKKTIDGDVLSKAETFTFHLSRIDNGAIENVVMPDKLTVTTQAITSGSSLAVSFDQITFKEAGIYKFSIHEAKTNILGMTNAKPQEINIEVVVENGILVVKGARSIELEFVNLYEKPFEEVPPEETTPEATDIQIFVKKTIAGDVLSKAETFTFHLSRIDNGAIENVVMPDQLTVTTQAITSGSSLTVSFDQITFKEAGNYRFSIREAETNILGMIDAKPQEINIEVVEENGILVIKGESSIKLEFVNLYEKPPEEKPPEKVPPGEKPPEKVPPGEIPPEKKPSEEIISQEKLKEAESTKNAPKSGDSMGKLMIHLAAMALSSGVVMLILLRRYRQK